MAEKKHRCKSSPHVRDCLPDLKCNTKSDLFLVPFVTARSESRKCGLSVNNAAISRDLARFARIQPCVIGDNIFHAFSWGCLPFIKLACEIGIDNCSLFVFLDWLITLLDRGPSPCKIALGYMLSVPLHVD